MARAALLLLLLLPGLLLPAPARGQGELDLSDALDDGDMKPTARPPKKPGTGDDFNLEDALGGGGHNEPAKPYPPKPKPDPNPRQPSPPGSNKDLSDADLYDGIPAGGGAAGGGAGGGGGGSPRDDGEQQADSPGLISGIVGAAVVALAGAVSSFIAYQKKRLCFKENGEVKA
ncbi:CD99 antigen-like isoform X2 [Tenrec ecaudatus]|uniref:CD99 antigen-like isoform X2 n=1 Tax=Tenrec ecaudatus TaxID=94439 RepID=UPI003F598354